MKVLHTETAEERQRRRVEESVRRNRERGWAVVVNAEGKRQVTRVPPQKPR